VVAERADEVVRQFLAFVEVAAYLADVALLFCNCGGGSGRKREARETADG
jgi:hypothetical protein